MRRRGIIVGGITLLLLFGCNNGIAELEKKNSFYESVIKIGQGFQEIFGIFGNAMGETLGIVKSGDNKSEVGKHFDKIKKGLENTKNKLGDLSGKISEAKNADTKGVETVISSASEVIIKLIESVTNLAGVTQDSAAIGDTADAVAVAADINDVKIIIENVNTIIEEAKKSGMEIKSGNAGQLVQTNGTTDAPAALGAANGKATAQAGPKLADEVSKADPWAMVDKIKNAKTNASLTVDNNNEAGALIKSVSITNNHGAKTQADLAAAVALKAMIKGGKLSAATNEVVGVKAAGVNAVNKVLGVLDEIIRRTVHHQLGKIKDAVKEIKYSETNGEATEVKK